MKFTLVSFHAHPDDEALLTAGTLAKAADEGHRVVLVTATAGEAGLTSGAIGATSSSGAIGAESSSAAVSAESSLGARRLEELDRSAKALGIARVVCLGYADSGMAAAPSGHPNAFACAPVEDAAAKLALVLVEESADAVTIYDPAGGYGHPDHVQVNRVGRRAAELAGTSVVLEATVDRSQLLRVLRLLARSRRVPADFAPARFAAAYTAHDRLTHRVNVGRYTAAKRASMKAHASQRTADSGDRTLAFCLRLPRPIYRLAFSHEWFVEVGRTPGPRLLDDIFATLRTSR